MEIIFGLLKHLATTLTPTEFITVLIIILVLTGTGVRYAIRFINKNRNNLSTMILGDPGNEDYNAISVKLNDIVSTVEFNKNISNLKNEIQSSVENTEKEFLIFHDKLQVLQLMKQEVYQTHNELLKDINQLKDIIIDSGNNYDHDFNLINSEIRKINETMQKILIQVDKIDDGLRTAIPEFRNYNGQIFSNVRDLKSDIRIIERIVQNQINNNAVTLR